MVAAEWGRRGFWTNSVSMKVYIISEFFLFSFFKRNCFGFSLHFHNWTCLSWVIIYFLNNIIFYPTRENLESLVRNAQNKSVFRSLQSSASSKKPTKITSSKNATYCVAIIFQARFALFWCTLSESLPKSDPPKQLASCFPYLWRVWNSSGNYSLLKKHHSQAIYWWLYTSYLCLIYTPPHTHTHTFTLWEFQMGVYISSKTWFIIFERTIFCWWLIQSIISSTHKGSLWLKCRIIRCRFAQINFPFDRAINERLN